jgi:hypothetical protein
MAKSQSEISSLNIDGREELIKLNIANALYHTFLVPPPIDPNPPNDYEFYAPPCRIPFKLWPTGEAEIYLEICGLAPKISSGWDEISVQALKRMSLFIIQHHLTI